VNQWNIPEWMEKKILERDKVCVYCGATFTTPKKSCKTSPSWEHIVNDLRIVSLENICRCCMSCNSSKGTKDLDDWFESPYCKKKGITAETVADIVKKAIENPPHI
jgi:5-methylcytosine-specific restriction endonuclease McrA